MLRPTKCSRARQGRCGGEPLRPCGASSPGRGAKERKEKSMIRRIANGATSEDTEQIHVMRWAEITANRGGQYEKLRMLFHIPNGGARSKAEGAIFKAMGVKSGVPDLFLPVPMEITYCGTVAQSAGLFIEMKARGGRVGLCDTCSPEEMMGVNTVEQLAQVEALLRSRGDPRG